MPFYEYECSNCKFYVEALQKISEPPLRKCPSCKKQTMKRLVSAPVFRLKGGGWYETDFKSDQEGKRNLAAGEEAPEAKSADDKEAKPAEPAKEADKKPAAETKKSESGSRTPGKTRSAKPAARPVQSKSSGKRSSKSTTKSSARKRRR
ncbi:MAG TPA: FmdB family zinc ribbon protein [Steroidobacteraceae bacterium]|nr:FmdB family zinc ribbon protein [Steroidobacteraceae bacterium]